MTGLVYVVASLLALVYAVVTWKVYPHFISIRDRVVKSPVQLHWGRFAASWLVFALVVIMIPLNWHEFDTQVHFWLGGSSHSYTDSGQQLNSSPTQTVSAAAVSKPIEQALPPTPATSQPVDQIASPQPSEGGAQQPVAAPSQPAAPAVTASFISETFAPSFKCAKASTNAERLICSNQQLSSLDAQLMQAYGKAMSETADKDSLKVAMIDWRKNERDACSTTECMVNAYQTRIQILETGTP